jgi:S-adenosylmethionine hydrolase
LAYARSLDVLRTKCYAFCGDEASNQFLPPVNFRHLRFKAPRIARTILQAAHYQAVPTGTLVGLIGSSGLLEISVNGGSAAQDLGLRVRDGVSVGWSRMEKPIIS